MARVPINEENMSEQAVELFDRLKLDTNEYARLMLPVNDAECHWVHTMRAPTVEHGVPVKEQKKRRNGSFYDDYATEFVGMRICLGEQTPGGEASLKATGLAPDDCPACASAKAGVKDMAPERRYAVPVIRYETRAKNSADVRTPPGARIYVWALTWRMWDQLVRQRADIRELYGWGPDHEVSMNQADIVLFCEDGGWQRVRFDPPKRPAWRASEPMKALIKDLWGDKDNRPTDAQLAAACGRSGDRNWMDTDVQTVEEAWRHVRAYERGERPAEHNAADDRGGDADLSAGLDELDSILGDNKAATVTVPDDASGLDEFMSEDQKAAKATAAPAAVDDDLFGGAAEDQKAAKPAAAKAAESEELFGAGEDVHEPAAAKPAAAKAAAAAPAAAAGEPGSFDDIMDDLN